MNDENYVPALEQSYCFVKGKLVFRDGTSYTLAEAAALTDPKLTAEDIQAIHLVKKMFDGEIQTQPASLYDFVYHTHVDEAETLKRSVEGAKTLDSLAFELGPPPLLNGSSLQAGFLP